MKKVLFRCNSLCFTHLLLFLLEKQILKSSTSGHSVDVYGTQLRDLPRTKKWGHPRDVGHICFFKFNSETY